MAQQVRAYAALSIPEAQQLAREQADAFQPMDHPYAPGSAHAVAWERAYTARRMELDQPQVV